MSCAKQCKTIACFVGSYATHSKNNAFLLVHMQHTVKPMRLSWPLSAIYFVVPLSAISCVMPLSAVNLVMPLSAFNFVMPLSAISFVMPLSNFVL